MRQPSDHEARTRALDPRRSMIVQAPAGSGKTELLTRRFLVLLARVDRPEQILAITFTRKAAAEMRARILDALALAREPRPADDHRAALWELAVAALTRNDARGWSLLDNSHRLRIQTIDSLCAGLVRRLPVLSGVGWVGELSEDSRPQLQEAARRTLEALEGDDPRLVEALALLFGHLDGQWGRLRELLIGQLARRDQWLRLLAGGEPGPAQRMVLEAAIERLIGAELERLREHSPPGLMAELAPLARSAARRLSTAHPDHHLACLSALQETPPAPTLDALPLWRALAQLLLTGSGTPRARLTKNEGFPRQAPEKPAMLAVLGELSSYPDWCLALHQTRRLPQSARYTDQQWAVLAALIRVLMRAAAELKVVFAEEGVLDFIELSQAAGRALGATSSPSELALALDEQLRHLLVDEYQDTSVGQLALLEELVAGWHNDGERTLFLVGDPMQSIYRFREANVGLFLQAQREGVGPLRLERLTLVENFRSRPELVDWSNQAFATVLPADDDIDYGAVSHSPQRAFRPPLGAIAAQCHAARDGDPVNEAMAIAALVGRLLDEQPATTQIAILGRSRAHLKAVAAALAQQGIAFRAVDIVPLNERPLISDLLALTRALTHRGDRLAWFALLRAPFCGLALADLQRLFEGASRQTPWQCLSDAQRRSTLSPHGRRALARLLEVVGPALRGFRRNSLRSTIEGAWLALGGLACAGTTGATEAEPFFRLLEAHDRGGTLVDPEALEEAVSRLYAPADSRADGRVQLMTIHKAKGLEFDIVIVPSLGRGTRGGDPELLQAEERLDAAGERSLLLAPIRDALSEGNPLYDLLSRRDKLRSEHELGRLLYVACTRAKEQLHLFGHAALQPDGSYRARNGSLLAPLMPMVEGAFERLAPAPPAVTDVPRLTMATPLRRLEGSWRASPPSTLPTQQRGESEQAPLSPMKGESSQGGLLREADRHTARVIGIVVHRFFEQMSEEGPAAFSRREDTAREAAILALLRNQLLGGEALQAATEAVQRAIDNALADPQARWALDPLREQGQSELALGYALKGAEGASVIDRTFLDGDTRWIIDYKTSDYRGEALEAFVDSQLSQHRPQLEHYGALFSALEARPIRLALYFPLLQRWSEWAYLPSAAPKGSERPGRRVQTAFRF